MLTPEYKDNISSMKMTKTRWFSFIIVLFIGLSLSSCWNSEDINREIARLFYEEILNEKNTEVIDEIISPDIEFYRPDHKGDRFGIKAFRDYVDLNNKLSPDLKVVIDDMISEGNKVSVRYEINGTDKISGNKYSAEGISILQIDEGKITKIWENADDLNFLLQIVHISDIDYPHKHMPD